MISNMGRLLRQTALRFSDKIAVINVERNRRFTFWQLHELTNKACNMLRDTFGLREGDAYATLLENDNMSLLHLWMTKGWCTELWLSMRDSLEEHLYQIDYVKPRLVFIESNLLSQYYDFLSERNIAIIYMDKLDALMRNTYYFWELMEKSSPEETDVEYVADDVNKHICLLRFTGGTIGKGKCAMYSLSNILSASCNSSNFSEVFPHDNPKILVSTPITHASGTMILPAHFRGGTVITLNRPDIDTICKTVEREKVEVIYTVPTVLYRMIDMDLQKKYDLSNLKIIRYGTSPISLSKLEDLIKEFGRIFVQGYAGTETWIPGTTLGRNEHNVKTKAGKKRLNSVGRPVPGVEIKIADVNGHELPIGEKGEIWMRSPHTIQGYYNDPKQTKENFSENGFWKSGDIGFMDHEGFLCLLDRKKDMIISGGFNVYPAEVENCLNSHPAVANSGVIGIPHDDWGEAVHAEVVLKQGIEISQEQLINYCKQHIARYKAPKTIKFVDELPLTPIGKVSKREMRKKYWGRSERQIH